MIGYEDSYYGPDVRNTSLIPANIMSATAEGGYDWNAILSNGIRGAAQGAILASVGERFESGQLRAPPVPPGARPMSMQTLLLIAVVAYVVLK